MGIDQSLNDAITDRVTRGVEIAYGLRTKYRDQVIGAWVNAYKDEILLFTTDGSFTYEETFPGYSIGNLPAAQLERLRPQLKTKGAVLEFVDAKAYALAHCTPRGDT